MHRVLLFSLLLSTSAAATDLQAIQQLPFQYSVLSARDEPGKAQNYTAIEIRLVNGKGYFLNQASFYCVAENKAGLVWRAMGDVASVPPGAERTLTAVSNGEDAAYTNPNKVTCFVSAYNLAAY